MATYEAAIAKGLEDYDKEFVLRTSGATGGLRARARSGQSCVADRT